MRWQWNTGRMANPAQGVRKALPAQRRRVVHFSAMPWEMVNTAMNILRDVEGIAALALRFTILTAVRSGTVRKATWNEMNEHGGFWHIPGENMKSGKDFTVPLSAPAREVLRAAKAYQ